MKSVTNKQKNRKFFLTGFLALFLFLSLAVVSAVEYGDDPQLAPKDVGVKNPAVGSGAIESIATGVGSFISGFAEILDSATQAFEPVVSNILGEVPGGEFLFAKILFLIMIVAIVFIALEKTPGIKDYNWAVWTISIIVGVLSVRYIDSSETVSAMILPYSALGVAIAAFLPLIIYLFFVESFLGDSKYKTFRKIAWIFAGVVFLFLYVTRLPELGSLAGMYLFSAIVCVAFLIFDKTIQRAFRKARTESMFSVIQNDERAGLMEEFQQARERLAKGTSSEGEFKIKMRSMKDKASNLGFDDLKKLFDEYD